MQTGRTIDLYYDDSVYIFGRIDVGAADGGWLLAAFNVSNEKKKIFVTKNFRFEYNTTPHVTVVYEFASGISKKDSDGNEYIELQPRSVQLFRRAAKAAKGD